MGNHEHRAIRVLIANDQQIVRAGLRVFLTEETGIDLLGYTSSIPETIRRVGELQPDVLLIEPCMQGQDGLQALELIRGEWPQVAIVIFTLTHNDESMLRAFRAGICAYLTLQATYPTILHAIRTAARGETLLQPAHIACLFTHNKVPVLISNNDCDVVEKKEKSQLTERERAVLQRIPYGERNKEIAARLGISEPTVKSHLANIYYKLGVDSRASAVAVAMARGILEVHMRHIIAEA